MLEPIAFYRVSGAGNDFLALVEPAARPDPSQIASWCRRGLSLGADGLFILERGGTGIRMHYFNADGGVAALCLNGTRCAASLAFSLGWEREETVIETGAGPVPARRLSATAVEIEIDAPPLPRQRSPQVDGREITGFFLDVGVPYFVVPWEEDLALAPVTPLGRALRHHLELGKAGANIDFVRFPEARRLEIRTYERGVEEETLASGTGMIAGVAVGRALGRLEATVSVLTAGGYELEVSASSKDRWTLSGDARVVARGEILPAAADLPPRPRWTP
ncbi:MAG TPA: diaminopimelate epimerase [Thermoanaerobaculia bacterium]|nr:diaminopimelate epimerase [Thermoanaerobaculia bacterium]